MNSSNHDDKISSIRTFGSKISKNQDNQMLSCDKVSLCPPHLLLQRGEKFKTTTFGNLLLTSREKNQFEADSIYNKKKTAASRLGPFEIDLTLNDHTYYKKFVQNYRNDLLNRQNLQNLSIETITSQNKIPNQQYYYCDLRGLDKIRKFCLVMARDAVSPLVFKQMTSLEKMSICLKKRGFTYDSDPFINCMKNIRNLKELNLDFVLASIDLGSLNSLLARNSNLTVIYFNFMIVKANEISIKNFAEVISKLKLLKSLSVNFKQFLITDNSQFSPCEIYNKIFTSIQNTPIQKLELDLQKFLAEQSKSFRIKIQTLMTCFSLKKLTLIINNEIIEKSIIDFWGSDFEAKFQHLQDFEIKVYELRLSTRSKKQNISEEYEKIIWILKLMPNLQILKISMSVAERALLALANEIKNLSDLKTFEFSNYYFPKEKEPCESGYNNFMNSLEKLKCLNSLTIKAKSIDLTEKNAQRLSECLENLKKLTICKFELFCSKSKNSIANSIILGLSKSNKNMEEIEVNVKGIPANRVKKADLKHIRTELIPLNSLLKSSNSLRVFKLAHFLIDESQSQDLLEFVNNISQLKNLEEFELELGNIFSPYSFKCFDSLFEGFTKLENLRTISLNLTAIDDFNNLYLALAERISRLKQVRTLKLFMNYGRKALLDDGLSKLVGNFSQASKILDCCVIIFCSEVSEGYQNASLHSSKYGNLSLLNLEYYDL